MLEFNESLRTLLISALFILLAARIETARALSDNLRADGAVEQVEHARCAVEHDQAVDVGVLAMLGLSLLASVVVSSLATAATSYVLGVVDLDGSLEGAPMQNAIYSEIAAELDATWFAWSGPTTVTSGHNITAYYRIQGPHVVIEYAPQSLGGDPSLQVHTMYRDPTNDYGRRLIPEPA